MAKYVWFDKETFQKSEKGWAMVDPFAIVDRRYHKVLDEATDKDQLEIETIRTIIDKRGKEVPIVAVRKHEHTFQYAKTEEYKYSKLHIYQCPCGKKEYKYEFNDEDLKQATKLAGMTDTEINRLIKVAPEVYVRIKVDNALKELEENTAKDIARYANNAAKIKDKMQKDHRKVLEAYAHALRNRQTKQLKAGERMRVSCEFARFLKKLGYKIEATTTVQEDPGTDYKPPVMAEFVICTAIGPGPKFYIDVDEIQTLREKIKNIPDEIKLMHEYRMWKLYEARARKRMEYAQKFGPAIANELEKMRPSEITKIMYAIDNYEGLFGSYTELMKTLIEEGPNAMKILNELRSEI